MNRHWLRNALETIEAAPHPPQPWTDGGQLPWHDPAFSERVLAVHLDQDTHMASRSLEVIGKHVDWLEAQLRERLTGDEYSAGPLTILDVGCGPGLYCHDLARRGHRCIGFDFAPSAIEHAGTTAIAEGLDCTFLREDLTALPDDFAQRIGPCDVVTFWFGEFHSFPPRVAHKFLRVLTDCLAPGGLFVLEYQPWNLFPREYDQTWRACSTSVFASQPHLWLQEWSWDEDERVETTAHWILDVEREQLQHYLQCHQAYEDEELEAMLRSVGLRDATFYPPITGCSEQLEFPLVVTVKSR